jgi:alkylated DNA repair dioxygenase AlkB
MLKKRSLDSFFTLHSQKKLKTSTESSKAGPEFHDASDIGKSHYPNYPYPVPHLSTHITSHLAEVPASQGKRISDQPDLDLVYFQPYIPKLVENDLFEFLRRALFFYRVQYTIKRYGTETQINTPRYTTVFGVDTSSTFNSEGQLVDSQTSKPVPPDRYKSCAPNTPRPLPQCLEHLRQLTEIITGATYNFCLVNYYADGADSISYHSDDERFLGHNPSIASLSLGAMRDFCMKHKPIPPKAGEPPPEQNLKPPLKLPLASGDMVLMKGKTQANWLHSIPKRKGRGSEGGRINITFRKGVERYSTQNYYQYNVGEGRVWRWDGRKGEMREWVKGDGGT